MHLPSLNRDTHAMDVSALNARMVRYDNDQRIQALSFIQDGKVLYNPQPLMRTESNANEICNDVLVSANCWSDVDLILARLALVLV